MCGAVDLRRMHLASCFSIVGMHRWPTTAVMTMATIQDKSQSNIEYYVVYVMILYRVNCCSM